MIIALYHSKGIVPKLIRFCSRGKYDHAAIVHDGWCYESREGSGVRKIKFSQSLDPGDKVDFYTVLTTPMKDKAIIRLMTSQIGRPYDRKGVCRFLDRQSDAQDEKDRTWFCSEIVAWAFREAGSPLFNHLEDWKVTPSMLAASLAATKRAGDIK